MIVVDTNVVAYFVIEGDHTPRAERVRKTDSAWRVPALFVHEWLNVAALHVKRGILDRDQALRAYRRGLSLVTIVEATEPLGVLNLVVASTCSSYDCQFVALAVKLGIKLVTTDQDVVRSFPDLTENLLLI